MIRDLDDLTLTFSLWEQARAELRELEAKLNAATAAGAEPDSELVDLLEAHREKADTLLKMAIDALRGYTARREAGQG
jgi:hypothetical protein